ncbi:MAG: metal transporter [Terriglobales bacterium]
MPETLTADEVKKSESPKDEKPSRALVWASAILPVLLLAGMIALFFRLGTGIDRPAPAPLEQLSFERVELVSGSIIAHVVNTGPEPIEIAQVQVGWTNRASWEFEVSPEGTIPRLGRAEVRIPYPWVEGEPYEVVLISSRSIVFTHDIEIAAATPIITPETIGRFALLGIYVGVIPVFLGIGWLPFLRVLPQRWYFFLLSLTIGLLIFLGVDSLHEALETSAKVPGPYQGVALILISFILSILGLYALSAWLKQRQSALAMNPRLLLAYSVALGIGLHNLGEGLAIGAAYALGAVSVGMMLILGFTIHNLTEGLAVVAPVVQGKFNRIHLLWLGLLAGLPTIAGTIAGGFAYTATWAVVFLAIGAGAIFQVVIEITRYQIAEDGPKTLTTGYAIAGLAAGFAIMYITGLLVTA